MADGTSIFTIPPGTPFVDALVAGLVERLGDDALALTGATLLLPTRRACRALADGFLRHGGGRPLLLPRMVPIGDLDELDDALPADEAALGDRLELAPAIPPLRRRLLLARLILHYPELGRHGATSPAQAAQLADGLARFLDQVQAERLSLHGLRELVSDRFARHWQITLDFLKILTEHWPLILEEAGCLDGAERRNQVIEAACLAWRATPPEGPVIAAGSTGSMLATADLLELVAALPLGSVVLPGLNTSLGPEEATSLPETHPQFGMARLLARLGVAHQDVADWPAPGLPTTETARAALVNVALRPPDAEPMAVKGEVVNRALDGVRLVACPGAQEEAVVIALAMRRALETLGRTAALITPDRNLARRVAAELRRWEVEIDDSAGRPLAETPSGIFLRLAAEFAAQRAAPMTLLSLLKHPYSSGGIETAAFRARVRQLEIAALHGPRPAPGFAALAQLAASHEEDHDRNEDGGLLDWLGSLEEAAQPFFDAVANASLPFAAVLAAHVNFVEVLAATDVETGEARLWAGEDGEAAATFIAHLEDAARHMIPVSGVRYAALFETLMDGVVVRPRFGLNPRLHIWGLLEARLQHADLVCLGGLNEGTWPPEPGADPWLSRPMRSAFGLPSPDRRIGLAAHDFAQAFCANEVLLTRAERVDGTPTVPARWLLRLENCMQAAGEVGFTALVEKLDVDDDWLGWQAALDRPEHIEPMPPPEPRPPVAARPRLLSVTQVETWMRDPYAVYARHVLDLRALEDIEADPGAAERGTIVHQVIDGFVRAHPDRLPDDALAALLEFGAAGFEKIRTQPTLFAFWWPRFARTAAWFIGEERRYRESVAKISSEVTGTLELDGFTLTAKADRVDVLADGTLSVIDYKTGSVPGKGEVALGFAPQLPLEAAIAEAGGFNGIKPSGVTALEYWRLSGGDPAGEIKAAGDDVSALARDARVGLAGLVARFNDPATPYLSQPDGARGPRYSDYTHLARIGEWSDVGGGGDD